MLDAKTEHRLPAGTKTVGMWLFLAALTMLFAATMLAYFIIRSRGENATATLLLPRTLWLSTAAMLLGSFTLHHAVVSARRERQAQLRQSLILTCVLAALFCVVQAPALGQILVAHRNVQSSGLHLYGLVFFMILVHALHVIGGLVGLGVTTANAHRGAYDHENYAGVKHAAMYWHFLDVVWLVMYLGILLSSG